MSSPEDCILPEDCNLIVRKDRGNLIKSSRSVFVVLRVCEQVFEEQVMASMSIPTQPNLIKLLTSFVELVMNNDSLFPTLKCKNEVDHFITLTRTIIERYLSIRCKSYVLVFNEDSQTTTSKRNQLLKLVHNLHLWSLKNWAKYLFW